MRKKMYKYVNSGFNLTSDIEFHQCIQADGVSRDNITISKGEICNYYDRFKKIGAYFTDGKVYFYNDYCYLLITPNSITYQNKTDNTNILKTFILGYGLALLFHLRGEFGIHASAVSNGKYITLISGDSGAGKSTTTAALLEKGYSLAADDMVRVCKDAAKLYAYPAFPYQKLCDNEIISRRLDPSNLIPVGDDEEKYFIPLNECFENNKLPISSVIVLKKYDGDIINFRLLSGSELIKTFASCIFIMHLSDTEFNNPAFVMRLLKALECVKVYEIKRPADKNTLNEVTEIVDKLIKGDDNMCYLS